MLNCRVFSFYQLRNEGNERGKAIPGFPYLPFKFEPHPPLHLEKSPGHSALSGSKALTAVAGTSPLRAPHTAHPPPSPSGLACCPLQKSQKISSTAWLRMCSPVASGLHRYLFPPSRQIKDHRFLFGFDWGGWPPWVPTLVVFTGRKRKLLCNGEPCKMSVVNSGAGFSWLVLHIRYALHSTDLTKAPSPLQHVASPLQIASIQIIRLALKKNSIFNTLTGPSVCSLSWSICIHITACTRAAGPGPTTVTCSHSFTLPHVPDKMTLSLVQGATVVVTFIFWFFYWAQTSFSKWASLI